MDLRDYLRMLRRGWPAVLIITALFIGLASLYVLVVPKEYESSTVLLVSALDPKTIDDLQQGAQFSSHAVTTYAQIVDSATVLAPISAKLRPQRSTDELVTMVSATVPEDTSLILVAVSGNSADEVTAVANATAASAINVIPALESSADGRPLIRMQQIRQAVEPTKAVSPNVKRVLAIGFIVGLCVGLGVTIAAQTLDTRIRRADDVREVTDVPLLAVLPQLKRSRRQGLAVRDEPTGAVGDAYRMLRTNLRFLEATGRHSLVFTAVSDDRDGAEVPANLAWSLAQTGRRVLLVDLDLRQSAVAKAIGIESGPGLADVLAGRVDLPQVIQPTEHPYLRVVLAGTTQHSPSDLISAPMMNTLLHRMEHDHDYVIMHAPPLLSYTDAAVVSGVADGTVLTVAVGRTRAPGLHSALTALQNVRVEPLGVVLTGAQRSDRPTGSAAEGDPPDRPQPNIPRTGRHHPARSA